MVGEKAREEERKIKKIRGEDLKKREKHEGKKSRRRGCGRSEAKERGEITEDKGGRELKKGGKEGETGRGGERKLLHV